MLFLSIKIMKKSVFFLVEKLQATSLRQLVGDVKAGLCVCVHVRVCACLCVHMCVHVHARACAYMFMYVHVCVLR